MPEQKRFLVDVGIKDLPLPIRAPSKVLPDGQATIANISVSARIMHEFEARWIDRFIQILHAHREEIGTRALQAVISDCLQALRAAVVRIDVDYPYFIEKTTRGKGETSRQVSVDSGSDTQGPACAMIPEYHSIHRAKSLDSADKSLAFGFIRVYCAAFARNVSRQS